MTSILLAAFLLLILETVQNYADINVNLTPPSGNSRCGETIEINPGNETSVFASGKVPNGHCSIYFKPGKNKDYVCNKICVTFRKRGFDVCDVKVKFTVVKFENNGDETRVYDCWNQDALIKPWCPTTQKLQMDILESNNYHYQIDKEDEYDFSVDVTPVCTTNKPQMKSGVSNFNKKRDEHLKQIKVEGIIVGVCLACIFLVVMVVMYMYYRSKPTNNVPEEPTGKQGRGKFNSNPTTGKQGRGQVFTNIKNRLVNRRKSNVVCIENETLDSYQQVRQTEDDIDADNLSSQPTASPKDTPGHSGQHKKEECSSV